MSVSKIDMDGLILTAQLKAARQRVSLREAVTTWQLGQLLGMTITNVRLSFVPALVREGRNVRGLGCMYSRAGVSDLLSERSGRVIAFPMEPLLDVKQASEFLAAHGVRLTATSLAWYRTKRPELSPPSIKVTDGGHVVRYAPIELAEFAANHPQVSLKEIV